MRLRVALISGVLFGLGLVISGMVNSAKVLGFLDVAGDWVPTLAFVMGGALLNAVPAFRLILERPRPVLAEELDLSAKKDLDARLLADSALFGVGWGLAGFCPGPAVTALASGLAPVFVFVAAMVAGMALYKRDFWRPSGASKLGRRRSARSPRRR